MKPSSVLFKVRDALALELESIAKIYALEDFEISNERLEAIFAHPKKEIFQEATYEELGVFLDGLFHYRREESPRVVDGEDVELDNNLILKKLRSALQLKDMDVEVIFELAERDISKSQIKNLFRKPSSGKFLECSDAILNDFLIGLGEMMYGVEL